MKNIVIILIFIILLGGYFLPVEQIRRPIDKIIVSVSNEVSTWNWLFGSKDCEGDIENLDKGYCSKTE